MILEAQVPLGQLVSERPEWARIFDRLRIDYCCSGQMTLGQACAHAGLDMHEVLRQLEACETAGPEHDQAGRSWSTPGELIDHIVEHHRLLRHELPRLVELAARVAAAHGVRHPQMVGVCNELGEFRAELESHLDKEEHLLFPILRRLCETRDLPGDLAGDVGAMIPALQREHWGIAAALGRLWVLTDGYTAPADACPAYRALLEALAAFEGELRRDVHEESNLLFAKARAESDRPTSE